MDPSRFEIVQFCCHVVPSFLETILLYARLFILSMSLLADVAFLWVVYANITSETGNFSHRSSSQTSTNELSSLLILFSNGLSFNTDHYRVITELPVLPTEAVSMQHPTVHFHTFNVSNATSFTLTLVIKPSKLKFKSLAPCFGLLSRKPKLPHRISWVRNL
jgi:hypothetical protein